MSKILDLLVFGRRTMYLGNKEDGRDIKKDEQSFKTDQHLLLSRRKSIQRSRRTLDSKYV